MNRAKFISEIEQIAELGNKSVTLSIKDFRQRIASSFQKELHPSDHTNPYGQHAISYPDIPSWQTVT